MIKKPSIYLVVPMVILSLVQCYLVIMGYKVCKNMILHTANLRSPNSQIYDKMET